MGEKKLFTGDQEFTNFIMIIGFEHIISGSKKNNYYAHKNGKQIRVNKFNKAITFLDEKGFSIAEYSEVDNQIVNNFIKS